MPEVRLIDANALKRLIQSGDDLFFDRATESEFIYMIDSQPTIEAEPVRHGRWDVKTIWYQRLGMMQSECSVCKFHLSGDLSNWKFCPHCGARMDKEDP